MKRSICCQHSLSRRPGIPKWMLTYMHFGSHTFNVSLTMSCCSRPLSDCSFVRAVVIFSDCSKAIGEIAPIVLCRSSERRHHQRNYGHRRKSTRLCIPKHIRSMPMGNSMVWLRYRSSWLVGKERYCFFEIKSTSIVMMSVEPALVMCRAIKLHCIYLSVAEFWNFSQQLLLYVRWI